MSIQAAIPNKQDILYKMLQLSGDIGFVWDIEQGCVEWLGDIKKMICESDFEKIIDFSYINQRINPRDLPNRLQKIHHLVSAGQEYECEYRLRTSKGDVIWVCEVGFVYQDETLDRPLYCGVLRDITAQKDEVEDLKAIAYIDLDVNLPNLEGFMQVVDDELLYASKTMQTGTFFCVGVDALCAIEEAYDSKITEEVFRQAVTRLEELVGRHAKVGVLSSDTFGVLIPKLDETQRRYKAYEIIKGFSNKAVKTSEGPVRITVSIGSLEYPKENLSSYSLLQRARSALESARKFGQSAYHAYDYVENQKETFKHWVVTSEDFVSAMDEQRVSIAFQKIMDTKNGGVLFYEALIRMIDREGSVVPACMFMPSVEKMGLCRFADSYVLKKVIEELKMYPDIRLSVNVSALSLMSEEWLALVKDLLTDCRDVASRLIVEITETTAMKDLERVNEFIAVLHDLGCCVALDDFGAGQTSFSQLHVLNVDMIKVDGDFVKSMADSHSNKAFVKAMHMLAESFSLPLVVEGVESEDIADVLQEEGIYNFQGFAYSVPKMERLWLPEKHEDRFLNKCEDKSVYAIG